MSEYDYDPLPCEWCGQEVDTSKGLHQCREIDLLKRIDSLEATIQAAIGVIDNWKVPLLDPDGKDSSEAVMRLLADDLRKGVRG